MGLPTHLASSAPETRPTVALEDVSQGWEKYSSRHKPTIDDEVRTGRPHTPVSFIVSTRIVADGRNPKEGICCLQTHTKGRFRKQLNLWMTATKSLDTARCLCVCPLPLRLSLVCWLHSFRTTSVKGRRCSSHPQPSQPQEKASFPKLKF